LKGSPDAYSLSATLPSLSALIAADPEQYARIAVSLASNIERLAQVRRSLRRRLMRSPIAYCAGFAGKLGQAYRYIWKAWCSLRNAASAGLSGGV
jgi:predicted O-linked N-acetylglucosamine transferase (SPINDLY family)